MDTKKSKDEGKVVKLKTDKESAKYREDHNEVAEHIEFLKAIAEMWRTICGSCSLEEIASEEGLWRVFKEVKDRLEKIEKVHNETWDYVKKLRSQVEATN